MITVWEVSDTHRRDSRTLVLPLARGMRDGFRYDFEVDWGDGTQGRVTSISDPDARHIYAQPGIYTVTITGLMEAWNNDHGIGTGLPARHRPAQLLRVEDLGDMGWKDLSFAFAGWEKLTTVIAGDGSYLSGVKYMDAMFKLCPLAKPETGNWDTSSVRGMSQMFHGALSADPDVSGWDVSGVRTMSQMFRGALSADPDVSDWDVSDVRLMDRMFAYALVARPDVSRWNTILLVDVERMFYCAESADPDIGDWITISIESAREMFPGSLVDPRGEDEAECRERWEWTPLGAILARLP